MVPWTSSLCIMHGLAFQNMPSAVIFSPLSPVPSFLPDLQYVLPYLSQIVIAQSIVCSLNSLFISWYTWTPLICCLGKEGSDNGTEQFWEERQVGAGKCPAKMRLVFLYPSWNSETICFVLVHIDLIVLLYSIRRKNRGTHRISVFTVFGVLPAVSSWSQGAPSTLS